MNHILTVNFEMEVKEFSMPIDAAEPYHFKTHTEKRGFLSNRPTLGHRKRLAGLVSTHSSMLNSKSPVVSSAGDPAYMSICDESKIMPGL